MDLVNTSNESVTFFIRRLRVFCLLPAEATVVLFPASIVAKFFFSVNTITHKPLHLAWWNFPRTCVLITARSLLNIKVIGQRSRSHRFFVCFCVHDTAWTSWPGFTKCCTDMAGGRGGHYLALSKGYLFRFSFVLLFLFRFQRFHDSSVMPAASASDSLAIGTCKSAVCVRIEYE